MKINQPACRLLAGVLGTCMFEKGERPSQEQVNFLNSISLPVELDEFCNYFPLEENPRDNIQRITVAQGKSVIDAVAVLSLFGGDIHIDYAAEDIAENGLEGILARIFLVFHVVVPVTVESVDGKIIGTYTNDEKSLRFVLKGLDLMEGVEISFDDSGRKYLVHYGLIFDSISAGSEEEIVLLKAQAQSQLFVETCQKISHLDCEKILLALQAGKRCHRG